MISICLGGKAKSEDLRWVIVYQSETLQYEVNQIAANLNMHPMTVRKYLNLYRRTGSIKSIAETNIDRPRGRYPQASRYKNLYTYYIFFQYF